MKYAIIAAGEGSRLASEGVAVPKPLVEVGGEPLIDRQIRIFMDNGADEIVVICNGSTALVASHLAGLQRDGLKGRPVPVRFQVKSTPSSMHSFYEISRYLCDAPFVLTTVDTIIDEREFSDYVGVFRRCEADGLMGVTPYIDDEKPLYVETGGGMKIKGFHDSGDYGFVSAGVYGLKPQAVKILDWCMERNVSRMRNFQRALLDNGLELKAYSFSKAFDIDHVEDVRKAEVFLRR